MFVSTSLISPVPVANACDIPTTAALDHDMSVVPVVATVELVAVYANVVPLQIAAGVNVDESAGVGLTVIVCVIAVPGHKFAVGITVIVAVTGALVVFIAVNAGILVLPVAPKPIEVVLLDQAYVVPVTPNVLA